MKRGSSKKTYRFALLGHPVAHSQSPAIHQRFAEQAGVSIQYDLIDTTIEQLSERLTQLWNDGCDGLNLTLPLKQAVLPLVAEVHDSAQHAQATNTLVRGEQGWHAHNTDGVGFIRDLHAKSGRTFANARILIVGAGGAVCGLLPVLMAEQPKRVDIVNRTASRAQTLVNESNQHVVRAHGLNDWCHQPITQAYDLIIDAALPAAWSASSNTWLAEAAKPHHTIAYSLNYGERAEAFLNQAKQAGISHRFDGMGMLIGQAAEAFALWTGLPLATFHS